MSGQALTEEQKEQVLKVILERANESYDKREYVNAIAYFNKYLEFDPNNAEVYNMIGYIYKKIGGKFQNIEMQLKFFEKAYNLNPENPRILRNLTVLYPIINENNKAIECFHKLFKYGAIVDDYIAYSFLKMQMGDFKEGWEYYEYRFQREKILVEYPEFKQPKWEGQKILDKTLLVQFEQGLGDSIQFCRYIEQTKPLVGKIIFRVQDCMYDLLKLNFSDIEVISENIPLETLNFDYHIPLMSLVRVLNGTIDNIPLTQGYLNADTKKAEIYKEKYFDNDNLKIGISWAGRHQGNRRRNVPLEFFYPLTKIKNAKIYAFQKGWDAEELKQVPEGIEIIDLGQTFNDFSDTAAAMANIDLFVTSDNSVFNLAAAMGKDTYLLLNKHSEWRWFYDEKTTPWYGSVKIFKKKDEEECWSILIQKIINNILQNYQK